MINDMKIVQINIFPNLSTGNIMSNIHKRLLEEGIESYIVWGRGRKANNEHEIFMNDKMGIYYHVLYTRMTDKTGFASKRATKKLLKKLDEIKPDIIHLHNIHGYYINIEMLFHYIKENNIKVVWTLHDCWAFTGHCAYFEVAHCNKWKKGCYDCPQLNTYPNSFRDNSKQNYNNKKELFNNLNMTIVTPTNWLAKLVKESYLKNYSVKVINNGIDTNLFKPRKSNFREKYHLENKKIILGVASTWSERKGLNDFIKLSSIIDENCKIVLVGLNNQQIKKLPKNIISIKRTSSPIELAEIYSAADLYFSPSIEETFGMTIIESIACGTKAIVYKDTAMEEIIDKRYGTCIERGKLDLVKEELENVTKIKKEDIDNKYTLDYQNNLYLELYHNILSSSKKEKNNLK